MTSTQENFDVTLVVDGVQFSCQRNELAANSPYFEAMFSDNFIEKHKDVIEIQGVDAAAMKILLLWLKDSSLNETDFLKSGEEVLVVLQTAAMLQFERLQALCEEQMLSRWLTAESCLVTSSTADHLSLNRLHSKATAFALWHFLEVRHTSAYLDLPIDGLVKYLSDEYLHLGTCNCEFQVFEGVSCWLEHNIAERSQDTIKALSCVRMNFISISDLQSMLNYVCITNCIDAQLLLNCVMCLKERKAAIPQEESATLEEVESSSGTLSVDRGCCDTFKRIAGHIKSCTSDTSSTENSSVIPNERTLEFLKTYTSSTEEGFRPDILLAAQNILSFPMRKLPLVACIIGHAVKSDKSSKEEESDDPHANAKKNRTERNKKNGTPHIFFWDSEKNKKLIPLLPLTKVDQGPIEALGYTVISRGQDLYVVGGEYLLGYGNWNKSVWKYNVWSEVWTYETSLVVPRRHHSVVCLEDDMYIIGGCGKFRVILDSVDRYNFTSNSWFKCPPLPCGLYSAAACVHNNLIYVISCQVFCFYPTTNNWVTLNDMYMPSGSSFNTAMTYGDSIYLTGLYSTDLMCFEPMGDRIIRRIGNFQNPAGDACLVGDKIYSFSEENEKPCIEVFDIISCTFQILWKGSPADGRISFKKLGGCFPLVLYEKLRCSANNM